MVALIATLCWNLWGLSVYVKSHLPRARSLRIFDSLRAIIAFREACDPPFLIDTCELEIGMLNDAWLCSHLYVFVKYCHSREIVWFVKIFLHLRITLIIGNWVDQRHRTGGQVVSMCVFLFGFAQTTLWGRGTLPCEAPPKQRPERYTWPHNLVGNTGLVPSLDVYVVVYLCGALSVGTASPTCS